MMQNLLGYPVAFTGLVSMPRGIGSLHRRHVRRAAS